MRLPFLVGAIGAVLVSQTGFARQATNLTFVTMDGDDTVAIEQISRTASTLTGDLGLPQQEAHTHYVVHLRVDGSPERAEVINDKRGFFTGTIAFDEKARLAARSAGGGLSDRILLAPPNSHPIIGTSMGLIDQLVRGVHLAVGDSAVLPVMNIRNRNDGMATIKRIGADSVRVSCDGCMNRGAVEELRFRIGKDGGVVSGASPSQHWVVVRK